MDRPISCYPKAIKSQNRGLSAPFKAIVVVLMILNASSVWADTWIASAYCPCVSCCGKSDGITASGIKAKQGITCAINWLPFGSVISINGESYIVEDRGAKSIFGSKSNHIKRVDIYFASHKDALNFGKRKVEVEVI